MHPAPLGLYVHVPFCSAICNYCNFNRGLFDAAQKERYVEALVAEIHGYRNRLQTSGFGLRDGHAKELLPEPGAWSPEPTLARADTIYFGGGTPSLLEPDEIGRIIDACRATFDLATDAEITLEANPETVSSPRLAAYLAAGANRLSFGVQSFRDDELKRLSRLHGADRARAALAEAREAGFGDVSLDLMMWLPGQSVAEWLESVDQAIRLSPDHLSLYLLEVYPNAPLKEDMARAKWSQAPDDEAAAMYVEAMERLERAGYQQYEISNVARPGHRSRHNLKYWTDGEWLGFGCGAHSTQAGVRWKNVAGTGEYIERVAAGVPTSIDVRRLSGAERLGDALFTGLRLSDGVDLAALYDRYEVDVWQRYGNDLEPFVTEGLLQRIEYTLRLTRRGMLLAHEIMMIFV